MRILFVTGRSYLPQSLGGVQSSTDATIKALMELGHECAVACSLWGGAWFGLRQRVLLKLSTQPYVKDTSLGYQVYRSWDPTSAIFRVSSDFRPDVAVVQHLDTVPFAKALAKTNVPVVVYLRNLEFEELGGDPRELGHDVRFIANSQFTAKTYEEKFGIKSVVLPPLIDSRLYRTTNTGRSVTMINPAYEKGIELVLQIAEICDDIPFILVEGWGLTDQIRYSVEKVACRTNNISLLPRTNDMRSIYSKTRILLAPSQWEEAWGRVASEAHVSAIPVIGSNRGGLPEAIGPGGLVVPFDAPARDWAEALRSVWDDEPTWVKLSVAAAEYSQREELQLRGHVDKLLMALTYDVDNL